MLAAVIFDLDGVLIDSEPAWNQARHDVVVEHGGQWRPEAQRTMMGMSSTEWSAYMHQELGAAPTPQELSDIVVARLAKRYDEHLPLIPGARQAVMRLAREWPLALASSANRPIIELVLDRAGLRDAFVAWVSSEEVARGKPAPDVYLDAARRIEVSPERCAAVEDSSNGLRSAAAAGTTVVAIPNREFPPDEDALALAAVVLESIDQLTPERITRAAAGAI
ncbi:MAG TPA: HAD family phosphatase [Solirubrobacteraceae bacterium]|nr:HAD family phosphatase [Solirubrobacteraceae bacterium]